MKVKILGLILTAVMIATFLPVTASAVSADYNAYTPQNLTATLMTVDETHPYGSALLTFSIKNLPQDTDSQLWQVQIEKKIGDNDWVGVDSISTSTFQDKYALGDGRYQYEQLWNESTEWTDNIIVSFRVNVVLYDNTNWLIGQSDWSNVASIGLQTSSWAYPEVEQAMNDGLVPDSLKSKDLTLPITREEFCELAVLLYEKSTGNMPEPVSPNPFTDTTNPEILKAVTLKVTTGTSTTTFSPNDPVTREQCATFLFRTIKAFLPSDTVYDVSKVPDFPDQKDISSWAVDGAKYMSNLGIIKGDANGNFMPKANPNAGQAAGYGQATREQAILMSVRTYNKLG